MQNVKYENVYVIAEVIIGGNFKVNDLLYKINLLFYRKNRKTHIFGSIYIINLLYFNNCLSFDPVLTSE